MVLEKMRIKIIREFKFCSDDIAQLRLMARNPVLSAETYDTTSSSHSIRLFLLEYIKSTN